MASSISNILDCKDVSGFCSLIDRGDKNTIAQIIEMIKQEGEKNYYEGSNYYFMVSNLAQKHASIDAAIGPITVFPGSYEVYQSFGITYSGIRLGLTLRKIEATVADTSEALVHFFSQLSAGKSKALITDSGLVQGETKSNHAISLFARAKNQDLEIFINDSNGCCSSYQKVDRLFPYGIGGGRIHIYASSIARQSLCDISCNAIAIEDCEVFQKKPDLLDEMVRLNPSSKSLGDITFTEMTKLPDTMKFSLSPRKLTMRVQALILQSCLN